MFHVSAGSMGTAEQGIRRNSLGACLRGLAVGMIAITMAGCALTPVPVRILKMKPENPVQSTGRRVALVITDARASAMKGSNVFGLKRNGLWIPMAVVFLAHAEHFDTILARRVQPLLEGAGYEVVSITPRLESDEPEAESAQPASKATGGLSQERERVKAEVEEAKRTKKDAEVVDIAATTVDGVYRPDMTAAGAVVEIKVRSFFTDIVPFSGLLWPFIQSWLITDLYVYSPGEGPRQLTLGKKVRAYASVPLVPLDCGGETSYNASVNMAVRFVLRKAESVFRGEAFRKAVREAAQNR